MEKTQKVLLAGYDFYNYVNAIKRGLEKESCDVECYIFNEKWSCGFFEKIYKKLSFILNHLRKKNYLYLPSAHIRRRENKKLLRIYEEFSPDIFFSVRGDMIEREFLEAIQVKARVIWIYDSIRRVPNLWRTLDLYTHIFCFEKSDLTYLKERGLKAVFLPLCADDTFYFPMSKKKNIDISFVGSLSKERIRILKEVCREFSGCHIEIYGIFLKRFALIDKFKYYILKQDQNFKNKEISPREVNSLYARSKICINIHNQQSRYGANMRVYEILAAGAFEITDFNPYIRDEFGDKIVTYRTENELLKKIRFYLEHPDERDSMSEKGNRFVKEKHLFKNRIKTILTEIEENENGFQENI